ncbi:hypothetical protein [Rodentibacter pneumotropicus]|uniref:hypothetical protein n=1 Tax=Rodentibacter pneumotropicus TaxID=758 RepID=UPI00098745C6|nr:hypothetical protein [Rodentibacter pneumotropicus]OOF58862.1 hypothetical protein BKL50_10930 [Rodentibacter pneumotropicus]
MNKLLLMVTDSFMLERGTLPYCYFDLSGGSIGSGVIARWKINNLKNEISDIEFEIKYYNASFCLIAHSEHIFINNSTRFLPQGSIIKLNDNDLISLFNYKIRAKIFINESEVVTLQDELSYLVNKATDKTVLNLNDKYNDDTFMNRIDGNDGLLTLRPNGHSLDPLSALKKNDVDVKLISDTHQVTRVGYKFFNPHVETGTEYYVPSEVNMSFDEFQVDSSNLRSEIPLSKEVPSLQKSDMKQEDVILDPLFFIK